MFTTKQSFNYAKHFASQSTRSFHISRVAQKVTEIKTAQEFRDIVLKSPIAFVDFYATWCGPCKMISPYIEKFSEMHKTVNFFKVDVDESVDIARSYGISAMPTFIVFKQGKAVEQIVGANPQNINSALVNATKN